MRLLILPVAAILMLPLSIQAQGPDGTGALQEQMKEMKATLEEMRAEMLALRQELAATRTQLAGNAPVPDSEQPIQNLDEERQLLSAKVDEQYQTKIESASKYRVRLSGMVLMNLIRNRGVVDNLDFPTLALEDGSIYSHGSFGGSIRQSLLGFEVFGPQIGGARVGADVQFDFAGGFPNTPDGVTFGLPRLRTGVVRMTWPKTELVAGQDIPFFSPLSPSSVASLAIPAFSYSGNLWTWIPQVRVQRRLDLSDNTNFLFQGGILDPLTGETPKSQFLRKPQAGEASRQPAYATRVAWSRRAFDRTITLGAGSYYSRQDWGFDRNIDSWAATSDWTIPVAAQWEFSGEFYRGRALGGLGGGIGRTALFSGPLADSATRVRGLNSIGGWSQITFRPTSKLEWNGGFGQDNIMAADLRVFPLPQHSYYGASNARNRASLLNIIYRPRSDLVFSIEHRRLRTFTIRGYSETADHFNISVGVLF